MANICLAGASGDGVWLLGWTRVSIPIVSRTETSLEGGPDLRSALVAYRVPSDAEVGHELEEAFAVTSHGLGRLTSSPLPDADDSLLLGVEPSGWVQLAVGTWVTTVVEPKNEQEKESPVGPAKKDLELYQGDDFTMLVTLRKRVKNEATGEMELGDPIDLTGYTPNAQVRNKVADKDETVDAEFTAIVEDAANGVVRLSLTGDQTRALGKRGTWDFQMTDPSGRRRTYLAGKVTVARDVTRVDDA